jgi:hypothetical protein
MRDSDGFVLCHHGRPIRCLQCGDEYEAELSRGVDGGPLAHPEADMPANTDSSSPASSPPERSEVWRPIETAPKDGTRVDLWAKSWLPAFDRFESKRFADCVWMNGDQMCNRPPYWLNLHKDWHPTHWMPLPAPPEPSRPSAATWRRAVDNPKRYTP